MRGRLVTVLGLALLLAGALGLLVWREREQQVVRIAYPPIMASLPVFLAQEYRLFEQENIAVSTLQLSSSNDLVNALVAGQAERVLGGAAAHRRPASLGWRRRSRRPPLVRTTDTR